MAETRAEGATILQLADWRRRVAELYAEVRQLARTDPAAAHGHWRRERERLYREHPQSPLPPERRTAFRASHFPYDPRLRFELPLLPPGDELGGPAAAPSEEPHGAGPASMVALLPVSAGAERRFDRVARLALPLPGQPRLALYRLREYAGGLFLPFRDGTNGGRTYGAGRYVLDTAKGADLGAGSTPGTIVVDLNFAFQPSCAFDPRWACPLAPTENTLGLEIRAGECLT